MNICQDRDLDQRQASLRAFCHRKVDYPQDAREFVRQQATLYPSRQLNY